MQTCAFTGHRPQRFSFEYDETGVLCQSIKRQIDIAAQKLYIQKQVRRYLVGGALGVDMWAGEGVLSLMSMYKDISLCCVIPFPGHNDKWPRASSERLSRIMNKADVVYLQERYSADAYAARNRYLVDTADYLIAVYDNNHVAASGTGQTVRYAQCRNKPILLIHPDNAAVSFWCPPDRRKTPPA